MSSPSSPAAPPRPPWVILSHTASVKHDDVKGPPELSLEHADPPCISQLTVPTSAMPTRDGADEYPYVVAANDSGLVLLHMSSEWDPVIGFTLGTFPKGALVVARGFLPAGGQGARTGTAVCVVPDRDKKLHRPIFTITGVGILPVPGTGGAEYVVAELMVGSLSLFYTFHSGSDFWEERILTCPLVWGTWTTHDVIAHDRKLWWVDLTQGLLACNVLDWTPELRYVELPDADNNDNDNDNNNNKKKARPANTIKWYRSVGVSDGRLRFVDVSKKHGQTQQKPMAVVVWTMVCDPFDNDLPDEGRWVVHARTTLEMIWASNSYKASGMPKEVPVLAFLHPDKPDVVYFHLMEYLFAVDVRNNEVVELFRGPNRLVVVDCWRTCLPWVLPPS